MGKLFTITPDILQVAQDGFDDLIEQIGKSCTLVFPPVATSAGVAAEQIGNKPANRWVTGGAGQPDWSQNTAGVVSQSPTATVTLLINWRPKDKNKSDYNSNMVEVGGFIEVKGFQTDLTAVMGADHILVQSGLQSALRMKFVREGEAVDRGNIVQGRYFNLMLKRVS